MRAIVLDSPPGPLRERVLPDPEPAAGELLLRVRACGVCRTDLHILDGELPHPRRPLVLGHQIVAEVERLGPPARGGEVERFAPGDRVGVPWLAWTCGECRYCTTGRENLCGRARFTGYDRDGGFAELATADARYCFPLPERYADEEAAPLLCAGLIGYRSLRMTGDAPRVGIYGFGAAAHIVAQIARHQGREIFAFVRPGDEAARSFALRLGASWAGHSGERPPEELDAAIVFAPAGELVPAALRVLARGGTVVCGGIHMSDLPSFPYDLLWGERGVRSVANLTRADATELFEIAPRVPLRTEVHRYPLGRAADALDDLRHGRFSGAAVLVP